MTESLLPRGVHTLTNDTAQTAFINMPYVSECEDRLFGIIASLALFGLVPTAAVVSGADAYRLSKILDELSQCALSIHDLTWMESNSGEQTVPHLNMSFELGAAIAISHVRGNEFAIIDTVADRLDKTLSDARGLDTEIVDETPMSVFRAISNVLHRYDFQPEPSHFLRVYNVVSLVANNLRIQYGYATMFQPKPFAELRKVAAAVACEIRQTEQGGGGLMYGTRRLDSP